MYKYRNLIKPLTIRSVPFKLVPLDAPSFFMESKDLEGYPGHFYVTYLTKPCSLHPVDENVMVSHPYDELLIFAGTNTNDILDLRGEVSIVIGEECEEYTFDKPSVVVIPKGVPHGRARVQRLDAPMIHIMLGDSPSCAVEFREVKVGPSKGSKYSGLVKKLTTSKDAYELYRQLAPITIDERGVMDLRAIGPGEAYQIVQMHPEDLEGVNMSFSWEFCKTPGVWMSTRYAHVHPEPELLIMLSTDPERIYDLGASLEFWFGSEREVYVIDRPAVITIPRPWIPHTPLITQRADRPFIFMLLCPGKYTRAGYVETGYDVF